MDGSSEFRLRVARFRQFSVFVFGYVATRITVRLVFGIPVRVGVSEWVCRLLPYLVGVWARGDA